MAEAGVDGALIVQPINHKFDHSLVTRFVEIILSFQICTRFCFLPSFVLQLTFQKASKSH